MVGALHGPSKFSPPRHVITPLPYWPAMMNPAFFTDGRTITHSALFSTLMGTPLDDERSSFITLPDSFTRSCSFLSSAIAMFGIRRHRMVMVNKAIHVSSRYRFNISFSFGSYPLRHFRMGTQR